MLKNKFSGIWTPYGHLAVPHRLHRQLGALALFGEQKVIFESHVTFENNVMSVSHPTLW